jgi:hypothetical protein
VWGIFFLCLFRFLFEKAFAFQKKAIALNKKAFAFQKKAIAFCKSQIAMWSLQNRYNKKANAF